MNSDVPAALQCQRADENVGGEKSAGRMARAINPEFVLEKSASRESMRRWTAVNRSSKSSIGTNAVSFRERS
jgi:LDH2 family malate/lactate/ureidoglycolate dehydrogenase